MKDNFKDDITHLAASAHGTDLPQVVVAADVALVFSVVVVDDGVDQQRLAPSSSGPPAFAARHTRTEQTSFNVAAEASSHARLLQKNESGRREREESSLLVHASLPRPPPLPVSPLSMYH